MISSISFCVFARVTHILIPSERPIIHAKPRCREVCIPVHYRSQYISACVILKIKFRYRINLYSGDFFDFPSRLRAFARAAHVSAPSERPIIHAKPRCREVCMSVQFLSYLIYVSVIPEIKFKYRFNLYSGDFFGSLCVFAPSRG